VTTTLWGSMDVFSDIFQYRPGGATSPGIRSYPGGATSPLPVTGRQTVAEDGDPPAVESSLGGATSPLPAEGRQAVAEDGDPPVVESSPGGATSSLPATMNKRKYPSRNSVVVKSGNSPVILFVTVCVANHGQRGRCPSRWGANRWGGANCGQRGRCPSLSDPEVHKCIVDAWRKADAWIVGRYVIMPDHIHFFCSPKSNPIVPFARWMGYWKRLVAQGFPCNDSCTLGGATSPLPAVRRQAVAEDGDPPAVESSLGGATSPLPGCGHCKTIFQRAQWDTQLRSGSDYESKWIYVRNNPVRRGIVKRAEDWPYQGELNVLNWHDR